MEWWTSLSVYIKYLICANAVGLLLALLNLSMHHNKEGRSIDLLLMIVSVAGGSAGVIIPTLLFDRRPVKANVMLKLFGICVLLIQGIGFLGWNLLDHSAFSLDFWQLCVRYPALGYYLAAINLITLITFGVDKLKAIEGGGRVRIVALLGLCAIGGSVGGLLGMYFFRHKIRKDYFAIGVPMILVVQIVLMIFLRNYISL